MMKVNLGTIGTGFPAGRYLWVGICVLLALGIISTFVDLFGTSDAQIKHALEVQQRVIIDAKTGAVSAADRPKAPTTKPESTAVEEFDVGEAGEDTLAPLHDNPTEQPRAVTQPAPPEDKAPALNVAPTTAAIPKVARSKDSLVIAPAPEISNITPEGALPKRGEGENVTPAMIYSRNYTRKDDVATLHLVVLGLGFSSDTLALAKDLPPEVSFAFSPYGDGLAQTIETARNAGHEAWIGLPVQTVNYPQDDPGPLGLIATLDSEDFNTRIKRMLLDMPGIVGVILPPDETLSGTPRVFSQFLETLHTYGLIAVSTHPLRTVKELSDEKKIRKMLGKSDVILDDVPSEAVIKSKLAGLMDQTKERGQMVVLMHARPQTLILVKNWLKRITHEGVELAPLSATILRPPKMLTPDDVEPAPAEGHGGGHSAPEAAPAEGGHGGGH